MNYIIYCRKSSESEDRQVMSLDAQEKELATIAQRENLKVIQVLRESMSAKAPGRPVFAQMMEMISKGQADGIICWKLDRLARNPVDDGSIKWLLQISVIKHIKTADRDYWPTDNVMMMSFEFGMSNQYIRDLSANVKRGNREKMRRGEWPNKAPWGYLNNKADKSIIIDKNKSPWIVKMFNLYASGTKSFKDISNLLYEQGLRTDSGTKVFRSVIHRVIINPFYYGVMVRDGINYFGKHEPIISKNLFDKAQEVLNQSSRPKSKTLFFPLRGVMRCKKCGCMLTASIKKGYRYYYCTNGRGICDQGHSYMREEYLAKKVSRIFNQLHFDEELIEIMYQAAKEKSGFSCDNAETIILNLQNELKDIAERESRFTDGFGSGSLRNDLYQTKMAELNNRRVDLEMQLKRINTQTETKKVTLERTKEVFLRASRAKKEFIKAKDEKKHEILNTLLWNAWFMDKEITEISFKSPYSLIARAPKNGDIKTMLRDLDSNQDKRIQSPLSYR
jgi:site-specific DNA recombinase